MDLHPKPTRHGSPLVILIAAHGHSGSTLLQRLLGAHPRIGVLGELDVVIRRGLQLSADREVCTCGRMPEVCELWTAVRAGGVGDVVHDLLAETGPAFGRAFDRLVCRVSRVLGVEAVCVYSKRVKDHEGVLRHSLHRCVPVHLVRDPRAVAYSYQRKRHRLLDRSPHTPAPRRYGYWRSLSTWTMSNRRFERLFSRYDASVRVRYEDVVRTPRRSVSRILREAGLSFDTRQLRFGDYEQHLIAGNRMRMQRSSVIDHDSEYLHRLDPVAWWTSSLVTWGPRRRYGYS